MRKRKFLIVLLLILTAALCFSVVSGHADFGDFSGGSDYGGGSDWGDSGYDSGSSSWDSSDSYDDFSIFALAGAFPTIFVILAVAAVIVMLIKAKGKGGPRPAGAEAISSAMLRSIDEYRQRDPKFSEPALCEKISNLYVQMQNCWTDKNLEPLRPYFTDASYAQFDRQLVSYRQNFRTNYIERISVLGVQLRGWYEQENNDCMVASVRTRIVDYTKDDKTGQIISGSTTAEKFMTYEYVLVRSSGFVTGAQDRDVDTLNCPNCGAPLNINQSAKCPYCSSIITTKDYDWVISSIKGISQETR